VKLKAYLDEVHNNATDIYRFAIHVMSTVEETNGLDVIKLIINQGLSSSSCWGNAHVPEAFQTIEILPHTLPSDGF
jgi:hypothetical protein